MSEALKQLAASLEATYVEPKVADGFFHIYTQQAHTRALLEILLRDSRFWCDQLISLAGFHQTGPPEIMQVHYHLASIPTGIHIHVFTETELKNATDLPEFDSVSDLWKTANWHERETAELFGVHFKGHPDLRKLLLPSNWVGFPLRKNYVEQSEFHGVKVKY